MTITVMKDFPKELSLPRSDVGVSIRPLQPGDDHELREFFLRLPEEERFFLKEDVTSAEVIDRWVNFIDYDRVVPMVALAEGRIVADATLHRHRAGARRHIGEIRVVVEPEFRNQGLGSLLVRELVDIAYDNAMDGVVFELVEGKEDGAIKLAEKLGAKRVANLPNFVKDMEREPHSLVILELPLEGWLEW